MPETRALPPHEVFGDWAELSDIPGIGMAWAHSGLVVTHAGQLIGFHAGQLVTFDAHGRVNRVVTTGLTEGHGLTLDREGDVEILWVADPGFQISCCAEEGDAWLGKLFGKGLHQETGPPRVVKMSLQGEILRELPVPPTNPAHGPGRAGLYNPTSVAVFEEHRGGNGDVWIADGYGVSVVHRVRQDGRLLATLTGEEGAGRFDCPHAVYLSWQGDGPEIYVADRGNSRVQVYSVDGRFRRSFGEGVLNSPSGFAHWHGLLVVAELFGRLAAFGEADELVGYIGADATLGVVSGWPARSGWPNTISPEGRVLAPAPPDQHRFNSPHSIAADPDGNLYVSEWLVGGRYCKVVAR